MTPDLKNELIEIVENQLIFLNQAIYYSLADDDREPATFFKPLKNKIAYINKYALEEDAKHDFLEPFFERYLNESIEIDIKYLHNNLTTKTSEIMKIIRTDFSRSDLISEILENYHGSPIKIIIEDILCKLLEYQRPQLRNEVSKYEKILEDLKSIETKTSAEPIPLNVYSVIDEFITILSISIKSN